MIEIKNIIASAVEKHLKYDTSLTIRDDIDKYFDKERIKELTDRATGYYTHYNDLLNKTYHDSPTMITQVIRAYLTNFEPVIGKFDLKLYETWKHNMLISKNKICTFYMHVDIWLKKINSKPLDPNELRNILNDYNAYYVATNTYTLNEWLQNECTLRVTKGYSNSIWDNLRVEDCADYEY